MADIVLNERGIFTVRGQAVMLDSDLAEVYGVETRHVNQAVKRNPERFPPGYAFQLKKDEWENLKSQNVMSSWGGRRYLPRVFTEPEAIMLAGMLNSNRAIVASLFVVETFVSFRRALWGNQELTRRIEALEKKVADNQAGNEKTFAVIFEELKRLTANPLVPEQPRRRIGFRTARDPQDKKGKRQA